MKDATSAGVRLGVIGACLLAVSACMSLARVDRCPGRPSGNFIIVCSTSSLPAGSVSHARVVPFSSNRLAVTYFPSEGIEGATGRMAVGWPAYSDDGGGTWRTGDPFTWLDGKPPLVTEVEAGQFVERGHHGFFWGFTVRTNGGRFAGEFAVYQNPSAKYVGRFVTSDGGNGWHGPWTNTFVVPPEKTGDALYFPSRGVELPDGSLALTVYTKVGSFYEVLLFVSDDGGHHFTLRSTVGSHAEAPWGPLGACEPALHQFPDGELFCLMRTGSTSYGTFGGEMLEARSTDGGHTWAYRRSSLKGVMPKFVVGPSGALYCLYGRPGNEISVSHNRGRTWRPYLGLTPADLFTSGYCDMVDTGDGCGIAVFDRWQRSLAKFWLWEPPAPRNAIYGRFLRLE